MANYYFLGTRLPPLHLETPPDITFGELETLLKENLSSKDYAKALVIRRYFDIENIRSYWLKDEFNPYGNMDAFELEEALISQAGLPHYVYVFLEKYEKKDQRIKHFPELIAAYFDEESKKAEGFLKDYLTFEREWRLVLVGFRAKRLGRDVALELQFEDPDDSMVHQILAQKDAKNYVPPDKYGDLKAVFDQYQEAPLELHFALSQYRFEKIEEMVGFDPFSTARILGYMIRLIIVESWQRLSKEKGIAIVDTIIKEAT